MRRMRLIVSALLAATWVVPLAAQQPNGTIRGRITDEGSQPLSQATVNAGGRATLTGTDGRYSISLPAGSYTVQVRMLGYAPGAKPVTVMAGETVDVDLTMVAQAVSLSEIVVTGYGQQKAGDITGAVSQLTVADFNVGVVTVPTQLLQGKVAGVQVIDNNEPGGGTTIRIRGATSVNANSDPLFVVDGMPVGTGAGGGLSAGRDPMNFLNPNDIESITVLKDASAAAIYGANAANGVVLITTKSGGGGGRQGTVVEYTSSYSAMSVTRLPSILNAQQFDSMVGVYAASRVSMLDTMHTNWLDLITRTGLGHEQNLSVTTSSGPMFYRISAGYMKQEGILRGTTTERLSLALNYAHHLFENRLGLRANLKGTRTNDVFTPGDVLGSATAMAPTQPVIDPSSLTGYWDWPVVGSPNATNPVASLNLAQDHGTTWRSVGNIQADYAIPFLPALRANVNLGYDAALADRQTFYPSKLAGQQWQGHGSLSLSDNSQVNSVFDAYLNYNAPLNVLPGNVDVTAGYSYTQSHSEYTPFSETGLSNDWLGTNAIPTASNVTNSKNVVDYKLISYFGRLNYNLNDRYLIAGSVRRDGSSRFAPGHQWGVFPSVSLAWRLSGEPFLSGVRQLSDLKLRASWAKTGNQAFADYRQYSVYTFSNNLAQYPMGGSYITTIAPSAVDPNIKWEQTSSYNVGLDFGFQNQRISGSIDWYTKNTEDLLFDLPIAAGTNFSNHLMTNLGTMRNRGLEIGLSAQVLRGGSDGLSWTAGLTASHNANTLLTINPSRSVTQINIGNIGGGTGNTIQVLMPGKPINSFFVYKQKYDTVKTSPTYGRPLEGQYVDQPTVLDSVACGGATPAAGCVGLYRPDGIINQQDLVPFHSPWPNWELGFTSDFKYRNFDLGFSLRAQLGAYVYNNVAAGSSTRSFTGGGSPSNVSTVLLTTGFTAPEYWSDYFVESADFLRLDNITLGYSFNYSGRPWRVWLTVQNAFTITGYNGVDPTAGLQGIDNNIYPRSRTFTGGLSVRF